MKNRNSKKGFTLVEIMIVVVIIGLLAAMAIPAFNKVRTTSQEKTIKNNLRQLYSAAQQYFLETGEVSVGYSDLVGTDADKYIKTMTAAAGEDYSNVTIAATQTSVSVDKGDGTPVPYTP